MSDNFAVWKYNGELWLQPHDESGNAYLVSLKDIAEMLSFHFNLASFDEDDLAILFTLYKTVENTK